MKAPIQEIREKEIEKTLKTYSGNRIFSEALSNSSSKSIAPLLVRYISFNRLFGAGVSSLSSQLAVREDIFRDDRETAVSKDRSMDVASQVFAAGIDEFGDTSFENRPTHRILAQATMKAVLGYYGYSKRQTEKLEGSLDTKRIDKSVLQGYGAGSDTEEGLFRAMGFHIGSEFLADREFNILDTYLQTKYQDLVKYLENAKVKVSGRKIPAYHWIKIHTSVEEDHFEHALKAVNMALRYYEGNRSKTDVRKQIMAGISSFGSMQEGFMKSLK